MELEEQLMQLEVVSRKVKQCGPVGKLLFWLTFAVILVGCKANTSTSVPNVSVGDVQVTVEKPAGMTLEPYTFKSSKPGYATLHGVLVVLDPRTILPAIDDAIYLVPVGADDSSASSIPHFEVGEVPQADVDERTGEFMFIDIQPGRYAVVALTKGGTQFPTRVMDGEGYAIFMVEESDIDQTIELGNLSLP